MPPRVLERTRSAVFSPSVLISIRNPNTSNPNISAPEPKKKAIINTPVRENPNGAPSIFKYAFLLTLPKYIIAVLMQSVINRGGRGEEDETPAMVTKNAINSLRLLFLCLPGLIRA